jgi:type II secretory pathway pseudopilin PulG
MEHSIKKGAMFGLDARIALAIFGALSVISGAALYSAIQQSKATKLIADMNELGKAWEQYYLDTGTDLPQNNSSDNTNLFFYTLKLPQLVSNTDSASNWKGPYISYKADGTYRLDYPEYAYAYIYTLNDKSNWGNTTAFSNNGQCQSGDTCYKWIALSGLDEATVKAVDKQVDGEVDATTGNLRWYNHGSTPYWHYMLLKYSPTKNPND